MIFTQKTRWVGKWVVGANPDFYPSPVLRLVVIFVEPKMSS
jgi:hypothetical protein